MLTVGIRARSGESAAMDITGGRLQGDALTSGHETVPPCPADQTPVGVQLRYGGGGMNRTAGRASAAIAVVAGVACELTDRTMTAKSQA